MKQVLEGPTFGGEKSVGRAGHDPRRGALEQVQMGHLWRDLRHELQMALAPVPITATRLPFKR